MYLVDDSYLSPGERTASTVSDKQGGYRFPGHSQSKHISQVPIISQALRGRGEQQTWLLIIP